MQILNIKYIYVNLFCELFSRQLLFFTHKAYEKTA